ncbi:hypothetical protein ACSQ67_009846 [Phaseolus vulgaris]
MVEERVALPVLIDVCEKGGLDLQPCLMELPMELKGLILERVPGVDLAKVACTCSELRFLCSDNELWKKKCLEESGGESKGFTVKSKTMNLRVKPLEFDRTLVIKLPDSCSLQHLIDTLSRILPSSSSFSSLHLSLNSKDEIRASSPHVSLHSLGVADDDLIFYSFNPAAFSSQTLAGDAPFTPAVEKHPTLGSAEAESDEALLLSTNSEPSFLRRLLKEALTRNYLNVFKLLTLTVHRVVVEYGFVRIDKDSGTAVSCFPSLDDSPSPFSSMMSLRYARPLEFLNGESKGSDDGKEVFEMLKMVKDRVALPLLIDLCEKVGLDIPPCLMKLPTELKELILESVAGVDLARVACTCSELRFLCSENELWKKKYLEEFGGESEGSVFKDLFALSWQRKVSKEEILYQAFQRAMDSNPGKICTIYL